MTQRVVLASSNKGNRFTRSSISWVRNKHNIPPVNKKKPEERTVKDVSEEFGVGRGSCRTGRRLPREPPRRSAESTRPLPACSRCSKRC